MKLGIAGGLTRAFINSPLTPLFLLAAFALGLVALVTLPREEEPQISVPMVDIRVSANGLKAEDAEKLVTEPLETIVKSIDGVEHVYSQTEDDGVLVTARFKVGTSSDAAVLRVHDKVRANMDRIPVGIPEPQIVGRGIDDVAIVVVNVSPKPEAAGRWTSEGLTRVARELQVELAKLPDIGLTYIVGEQPEQFRVEPNGEKLSLYARSPAQTVPSRSAASATTASSARWSPGRRCSNSPISAISSSRPATAARSMSATSPTSCWRRAPTRPASRRSSALPTGWCAFRPCRWRSQSVRAPMPSSSPRRSPSGWKPCAAASSPRT